MARNKGFGVVEVIVIIAIVALIAFLGWRAWEANQPAAGDAADQPTTSQPEQSAAPAVNSDADLDRAEGALDETNVEGNESQEIDSQTQF